LSRNPVPHSPAEQSVRRMALDTLELELLVSVCRMLLVQPPTGCIPVYKHEVPREEMRPAVIDGIS
jgi:hypothetical protein